MQTKKYDVFQCAERISRNTNKAIDKAKPWFLRPLPKLAIIVSMIILDGITTYFSIYMKLSVIPVLTIILTCMFAFLLNVPQEQAALHLKDYIHKKKPIDIIIFIIIELGFIAMQIFLSFLKVAVAPDLIGSSATLGSASTTVNTGDGLLVSGMAGALIVSSIVSSIVCFALGMKEDPDKQKLEVLMKTKNRNYPLKIQLSGARNELESINADKLNATDYANRFAAKNEVEATTLKDMVSFRDRLQRRVDANGINDIADQAQKKVNEYEASINNERE